MNGLIERRKPRIYSQIPVSVKTDGVVLSGMSRDIGMGGLYVATDSNVARDTEVVVTFRIPLNTYALTVVQGTGGLGEFRAWHIG
ncbi:MAG TPA: PilZ domain-containing protein [Geobacteraceae bacterium]|nr:PilZ domain-containing protein [Geobacteraceae bacterium]